jgi:hypothetical protein
MDELINCGYLVVVQKHNKALGIELCGFQTPSLKLMVECTLEPGQTILLARKNLPHAPISGAYILHDGKPFQIAGIEDYLLDCTLVFDLARPFSPAAQLIKSLVKDSLAKADINNFSDPCNLIQWETDCYSTLPCKPTLREVKRTVTKSCKRFGMPIPTKRVQVNHLSSPWVMALSDYPLVTLV